MRRTFTARGVGIFLAGALVGMLLISPATAHFTQNTTHLARHVWRDFIKQRVFTKAQANNRFLRLGGAAEGDLTGTYPDPSIGNGAVTGPKLANLTRVTNSTSLAANSSGAVSVGCPPGAVLISGGSSVSLASGVWITTSMPAQPASTNAWQVSAVNTTGGARTLVAIAHCLPG